jgi:hypothetical protein
MPYAGPLDDAVVLTRPGEGDLRVLAAKRPRAVTIFEYPFDSLTPLAVLAGVEVLKIQDSGALRSLDGAGALLGLQNLVISTPPAWDGSSRKIQVASLQPLQSLTSLERLLLLGVRPQDLDLSPIMRMTHLTEVDIGGVAEFTLEHYAKLAAALPHAEGRCLRPYYELKGVGFCKKCKGPQVLLNGAPPRTRKWLCPRCNQKPLEAHVAAWERARRAARITLKS